MQDIGLLPWLNVSGVLTQPASEIRVPNDFK